jgi:hypothetical protein
VEKPHFVQICLFSWVEKTHVSIKENHLCQKQEHLAHCFTMITELVFEWNNYCNLGVSRWQWLYLLLIGFFTWAEETHVSLQRKLSMVEAAASGILFQCVFQSNTACISYVSRGDRLCLLQKDIFSWVWETHVSLQRKLFRLEASESSTLFPCEKLGSFWKEYFL